MKKCNSCGAENNDEDKFCKSCGANLENQANTQPAVSTQTASATPATDGKKPWGVFAIIGFVFGILSLVFCWIPFSHWYIGAIGIVFSCMGKWSVTKRGKATAGFTMSLIGTILNVVFSIGIIVFAVLADSGAFDWIEDIIDELYYAF